MVLVTVPWIVLFLPLNLVVLFAEIVKRENLELVMVKANVLFKSQSPFYFLAQKKEIKKSDFLQRVLLFSKNKFIKK